MINRTRMFATLLALSIAAAGTSACTPDAPRTERWATTENTNVKIDWDKVNEAYKQADGPADLEKRINEIYEGDELISISVNDADAKTQVVTGFFDKDGDGQVSDPEKIFTVQRTLTGEGQAQMQTQGYGAYSGYYSPMLSIASGMLLGSMMSSMFMPSYTPMYSRPYVTSPGRRGELSAHRSGYRAANPTRFTKPSQTGRAYGGGGSTSGAPARSRGGSRFGAKARGSAASVTLLQA
jgi:hypothetical protein